MNENGPREHVSITLQPVEQFGQGPIDDGAQEPGSPMGMTLKNWLREVIGCKCH